METVLILKHVHVKLAGRVLFVMNVFVYLDVKMGTVKIQWNVFAMMDGKECFVINPNVAFALMAIVVHLECVHVILVMLVRLVMNVPRIQIANMEHVLTTPLNAYAMKVLKVYSVKHQSVGKDATLKMECAINLRSAGAGLDGQEIPVPIVLLHGVVLMDIVKNLSNVSVKMVMLVKIVMLQWPLMVIGVNGAPGQHVLQGANKLERGSVMTHHHLVGGDIVQKMEVSQLKQEIVPIALKFVPNGQLLVLVQQLVVQDLEPEQDHVQEEIKMNKQLKHNHVT